MPQSFQEMVSTLKLRQLAQTEEQEALATLLVEISRYRLALQYYANPKNWVDGTPMLADFQLEDNGRTAQVALRLVDYVGEALITLPEEEAPKEETAS